MPKGRTAAGAEVRRFKPGPEYPPPEPVHALALALEARSIDGQPGGAAEIIQQRSLGLDDAKTIWKGSVFGDGRRLKVFDGRLFAGGAMKPRLFGGRRRR